MMKMQHSDYMELAIAEAEAALALGEIPVGCVVVKDGEVIGRGHNTRETARTALGHAELTAITDACARVGGWRLTGCTLYVTLEPCPMCMGAILNARIDRLVFGAWDGKAGCCGSRINLNEAGFNHRTEVLGGIRELACGALLSRFFSGLRSDPADA